MMNQLLNFIRKTCEDCDARDLLCFSQIIVALIQQRTVNLAKLSLHCSIQVVGLRLGIEGFKGLF